MPPEDDDLNFEFNNDLTPPADAPPEGEGIETPPPAVTVEDFNKFKEEYEALKTQHTQAMKWQQDAARFFGGGDVPPDEKRAQLNKQIQDQMVGDTAGFLENLKRDAVAEARALMQQELMINEYRQKNPDLVDYEPYISYEVSSYIAEQQRTGKQPTEREAMETGITRFKEKFQKRVENAQREAASDQLKRSAISLSPSGSTPGTKAVDISKMSNQDFEKLWDEKFRQAQMS